MNKVITSTSNSKESYFAIICSFITLFVVFFFQDQLYGVFGEQNYLTVHLIMEFLIVTISFSIAIQSWMTFPYISSSYRLGVGALFFSLGILEVAHTITYKGMPFFLSESSAYKATWFFIAARLTGVIGIFTIVVSKDRTVAPIGRILAYFIASIYTFIWLIIVFFPTPLLPALVKEGLGTTTLKNNLEYVAILFELVIIYVAFRRFKLRTVFNLMIIISSVYMIIADYFFITYKSVYDINNFTGHLFQFAGYYFLQRAVYRTSVEEPFEKQKEALEKIQYMAFHDELTKLPNLRCLNTKWTEIIKVYDKATLLVIDINRFKKINEALGHSFGDIILKGAATRFQEILPSNMFLGRLISDQFVVLLPGGGSKEYIETIADNIQKSVKHPLKAQQLQFNISLSIGASLYPDHGTDFNKLIQRANLAIIETKHSNQSFKFFHPDMEGKSLEMLVLENDLYHALAKNELFIVYQPQVNISTGEIVGIEALLRWQHPVKGLISPGIFIPIAEKTGLIVPIGEWVLRTSCKKLKEWQDAGFPSIVVGVNLSTRQLYQRDFAETVKNILNETKISPQYLELEITESMLMNMEYTLKTITDLKKLGLRISIDDFGTGYSSLAYLKDLPIDRIKIDRSFVNDLREDNTTFISMIISLSQHLKLDIIAEGVETIYQKNILYNLQCHEIQGYEFSPPIEMNELMKNFDLLREKANQLTFHESTIN